MFIISSLTIIFIIITISISIIIISSSITIIISSITIIIIIIIIIIIKEGAHEQEPRGIRRVRARVDVAGDAVDLRYVFLSSRLIGAAVVKTKSLNS